MDELKKKREQKAERKRVQDENVKRKQQTEEGKKKNVKFGSGGPNEENTGEERADVDYGDVNVDEAQDKRAGLKQKPTFLGKRKLRSSS